MIHSMTGFGKASLKTKYGFINVEIRSLNHKFFEPSIKLPNGLSGLEDRVKKILQQDIKRGKIYVNLGLEDKAGKIEKISIDLDTARAYRREINNLKKKLSLKGSVGLDQFIALPGVINFESPKADSHKVWGYARKAIIEALACLVEDRRKEGRALHKDLLMRAKSIKALISHIDARANINVVNYKRHLNKRIKELTGTRFADKGRLEQEVAIFAKNCDITEELTRIKSHVSAFRESLAKDHEAGKKLDFIAQELHREINTVGAKASDFKISRLVIQIKSEIEKIREQVKNVQ